MNFTGHNALRIETNVDVRMSALYCSSAVQSVEFHIQYMTAPLSAVFKKSGVHARM